MNTTVTDSSRAAGQKNIDWLKGLVAPLLILIFSITGQWLITRQETHVVGGVACYMASLALFIWIILDWPDAALSPPSESPLFQKFRPLIAERESLGVLILGILFLTVMSFDRFAGNSLMNGLWLWLGAILFFLLATVEVPKLEKGGWRGVPMTLWHSVDKRAIVILLAIILLATFFQVYRLNTIPAEMTSDHAEKLLDVQDVLDGQRPIFFPRNTGREAFQFYLTAALVRLTSLPVSHLALKVGTALFGILAIPFTFLIGREFYGRSAGLLAAFFLAVSHWHVTIARVGLRFPFTAAFATPALYFLFRAFRANRRNDWLLAALFLGLGLHTYSAMRIVPFLFVVLIGLKLMLDGVQKLRKRPCSNTDSWNVAFWQNAFLGGLFTILLALPLLRIIKDEPAAFWNRTLSRTQATTAPAVTELGRVFLDNVKNALLMFNVKGDVVPINTIPDSPVLGLVSAALFVLGSFALIWRLGHDRDRRSLYILVTLFVLLLPSILSLAYPVENPSVVRTGGAVPWVMLIAALPLVIILTRLRALPPPSGEIVAGLVFAALCVIAIVDNYEWYFVRYDAHIRRSLWNSTEMGAVLRDFIAEGGDPANAYHVYFPHWVDTRNIGINAGDARWANGLGGDKWLGDHSIASGPKLYLLSPNDIASLRRLMWLFPRGQTEIYDSPWEGKDFVIFRVP